MRFTRLKLENWKNFLNVDVALTNRTFLVGPNASGKSNLLDALRFLRDVADPEHGFKWAVDAKRGGVSHIRSLHARRYPNIAIEVDIDLANGRPWTYRIEFTQDNKRRPTIEREVVRQGAKTLLDRPDQDDDTDTSRLFETHLEQTSANQEFRPLREFLEKIKYLHIVPQLVREPDRSVGIKQDPFGGDFLEQLASASDKTRDSRFRRIRRALQVAVPRLQEIELKRDKRGVPHLHGLYRHWRPGAGWQGEDQFSDGTLRLFGLLWSLLDGKHPLLLEEPELSLHPEVVRYIPVMIARLTRSNDRQVFISTHSSDLLRDEGIAAEEVLLLRQTDEDSKVSTASSDEQIVSLLEGGSSMSDAVLPRVAPTDARQLTLFGD